jgi:hypothetical protein
MTVHEADDTVHQIGTLFSQLQKDGYYIHMSDAINEAVNQIAGELSIVNVLVTHDNNKRKK